MDTAEIRRLRLESLALGEAVDALNRPQTVASDRLLVQTAVKTTYPTTPNGFYYCQMLSLSGPITEGGVPTVTPITGAYLYAYNIGTGIPPQGSQRIVHARDGRWIFSYC